MVGTMKQRNTKMLLSTCQTCAKKYDPTVTTSPGRYCSHECYDFGSLAYNKAPREDYKRESKVVSFAIDLVNKVHYLYHDTDDRFDCDWDLCMEAKILGL